MVVKLSKCISHCTTYWYMRKHSKLLLQKDTCISLKAAVLINVNLFIIFCRVGGGGVFLSAGYVYSVIWYPITFTVFCGLA